MSKWSKTLAAIVLSIVSYAASPSLYADSLYSESDLLPAPAIVTSIRGAAQHIPTDGKSTRIKVHDVFFPEASTIQTGAKERLFLVFSNGVSIGMDSHSKIEIESYKQRPFPSQKEGRLYEPSVSELLIHLKEGNITVASDHLSPLSKFTIELPLGEVRIHSASTYINFDQTGVRITAYSGSLTFNYPQDEEREFIMAPASIRISKESAALSKYAEATTNDQAPEEWRILTEATEKAGKRVFFQSQGTEKAPQPVLVVPNEYFEQPGSRPYELIE